jgi:glycerophosphoryl diester phosphodiesterase
MNSPASSARHGSTVRLPVRGLCAHRGAMEICGENTRASLEEAVLLGAHMIEFDVRLSKDGQPIVIHDRTLDKFTDGVGKVSDFTVEELKRLTVRTGRDPTGAPERLLTLREALHLMPLNVWLNIHVKDNRRPPGLLKRLIRYREIAARTTLGAATARVLMNEGRLHQALLACGAAEAQAARRIDPRIQICYLRNEDGAGAFVGEAIALGAQFVQFSKSRPPSAESVERLQRHGMRSTYCCVRTREELERLFASGVEFPIVDNIHELASVGRELGLELVQPIFSPETGSARIDPAAR